MSSHSSLDPESFQNLLADAYVVQESGIDTRSLSAVLELQGLMADSELDLERAMPLMADRARNVAQASLCATCPALRKPCQSSEYRWNTVYPLSLLPSYDDFAHQ